MSFFLKKKKKRKNSFIVEGLKEIKMALKANYIPEYIFLYKKIYKYEFISNFFRKQFFISYQIYKKISFRKKTGGIIASFFKKKFYIKKIKINLTTFLLVLEGIEKPGNLGAILRTTEAAGIDAVLLCNNTIDIFNPNVIRSSLGAVFTNNITIENYENIILWLKTKKIKIISTSVKNNKNNIKNIYNLKLENKSLAIVIGAESKGLSENWFKSSNIIIHIPMKGKIDSLNVSTSTAIILFEIIRQNYN
ncbi:TrmH family RNA methyltransferase [Candidatus Karelsulcia muelleri]|uniref:TrmH family RNA methyltransferase n=1 Tax=Candidatus Karelsulcia muelleri TaxID=336810 RepID=UPI00374D1ED1